MLIYALEDEAVVALGLDDLAEIALSSGGAVLDSQVIIAEPCAAVPCGSQSGPPLPPPSAAPLLPSPVEVSNELPRASAAVAGPASGDSEMPLVLVDPLEVSDVPAVSLASVKPSDTWSMVPCAQPSSLGGTTRFAQWIRSLGPGELADISSSLETWKVAELAWLRRQEKKTPMLFQPKQGHRISKLATRLAKGCEYSQWFESRGGEIKGTLAGFLARDSGRAQELRA